EGGGAGRRERLVAGGVVLDPAAGPEAALEVTRGTRAGVEHRPEAVPVGERVVRGPFVFKQVPPGGDVGRTRGRAPDDGQAVREEAPVHDDPGDPDAAHPEDPALVGG